MAGGRETPRQLLLPLALDHGRGPFLPHATISVLSFKPNFYPWPPRQTLTETTTTLALSGKRKNLIQVDNYRIARRPENQRSTSRRTHDQDMVKVKAQIWLPKAAPIGAGRAIRLSKCSISDEVPGSAQRTMEEQPETVGGTWVFRRDAERMPGPGLVWQLRSQVGEVRCTYGGEKKRRRKKREPRTGPKQWHVDDGNVVQIPSCSFACGVFLACASWDTRQNGATAGCVCAHLEPRGKPEYEWNLYEEFVVERVDAFLQGARKEKGPRGVGQQVQQRRRGVPFLERLPMPLTQP